MKPTLTAAERELYNTRLIEAREKRHLLLTGKAVEQLIDQNSEQVRYTKMTIGPLEAYIKELEDLLNPCAAAYNRPRPIGFLF